MDVWDLTALAVEPRQPEVLHSDEGAARVIAINLPAGEELGDHQVHERAWLVGADGEIEVRQGGQRERGGPRLPRRVEANERHEVRATSDARLVLILAPWPGAGHPSQ